jgi:dihydrolipoamide dehydrogenase
MKTQLAVIGAGPGGYAAAFRAADLGLQVTLIDPSPNPGGICLYVGCIPSKALLHVAKVIGEAKGAESWGVEFGEPKIDIERVREWKNEVVKKLTDGLGLLAKRRQINYVQGTARFLDGRTLELSTKEKMEFENAIVATGSRPVDASSILKWNNPPSPVSKRGDDGVIDSTSALELGSVPESMLVVGGGYIGLEIGTVYAALGSKVSVVEMTDSLLPGVDKDLVAVLAKRLSGVFEKIMLNMTVEEVKESQKSEDRSQKRLRVKFKSTTANPPRPSGTPPEEGTFEKILVAVGRRPNTKGLGLENTKVEIAEKGFVRVDEQRRTAEESIFAIGDVAGEPMLAHKASHEGITAAEAIAGHKTAFEPRAIPAVVFTDPEIAWCGLTEVQAKTQGKNIKVSKFPWAASGRAATLGRSDGLTKLIIEPESERILGVGIAGPGAGELIAEGVLGIEMGANVTDLQMTIHPHPTLTETMMEAAEAFSGMATHIYSPKRR